jgi:dTDP-4-amino-4,6-dideoxygalactose transaminase
MKQPTVKFIENKTYRKDRVSDLLDICAKVNMWANRGPLYWQLADAYSAHMHIRAEWKITPCANGGIALEAMARLHDLEKGRRLRWLGSAYSFKNLGRGYFADMLVVDCDKSGLLDLKAVDQVDPDNFDGIIVTNPHGLAKDFDAYFKYAKELGKPLLLDNAAGMQSSIPDWPWQTFSLHHTKPYGFGEGGLALTPAAKADDLYSLLNYGDIGQATQYWLNNGKLSDISCAFLIDRLENIDAWAPLYSEQRARIVGLSRSVGLQPLLKPFEAPLSTSVPFLAAQPVPVKKLRQSRHFTFAKYYQPIAETPNSRWVFDRSVNIPTHPDMANLTDREILEDIHLCHSGEAKR